MADTDYFKHIDFVNHPEKWPKPPFLPMLKRVFHPDGVEAVSERLHGVIYRDYSLTTVKDVNLFMLPPTKEEFAALEGWTYASVEEMVADGWEVD